MRAMIGALAGGAFVDKGGAVVVQLALAASAPTNHSSHENGDDDDDGDDIYIMMQCLSVCHEKWSLPLQVCLSTMKVT